MEADVNFDAPVWPGDPFSDDFFYNAFDYFPELRALGPVFRLPQYGIWGMAQYEPVKSALADWETFISSAGAGIQDLRKQKAWRPPSILLETDPPLHDVTRGAMNKVLSIGALRERKEAFQAEADRMVDALVERGTFDAVSDLAIPFPLKVMGDAVGVPPEGRECLLPFSNMLFNSFGPPNEVFLKSIEESKAVVEELYRQCSREVLTGDGFGAALYAAVDRGEIPEDYAPALVRSILSAGFDTTVNGLSSAIYAFAQYPEQWQILRDEPNRLRTFFDEVIRWASPVQTFFRTTSREVEVDGFRIGGDEKVLLFLAAANHDPDRWESPEVFDITRKTIGHVGFGHGIHVCVGQMVARMEAEVVFGALCRRVAGFELAGTPVYKRNNTLRGFEHLPVRLRLD